MDESQPGVSRVEAQRRVLAACEAAVERLAADPRYFARPTRSLFEEVRRYFPITQQARVYVAVDEVISRASSRLPEPTPASQRSARALPRAHAQGPALPARRHARERYCPSHAHLDERIAAGFVAGLSDYLRAVAELRLARELAHVDAEQPDRRAAFGERLLEQLDCEARERVRGATGEGR